MNNSGKHVLFVVAAVVVVFFSLPGLLGRLQTGSGSTVQAPPVSASVPISVAPSIQAPPPPVVPPVQAVPQSSSGVIENAYENRTGNLPVTEAGVVTRILSDDNDGSRHQRFILTLASGHTVLIAHNIDIAPRLNSLREGDQVIFSGVYEWNEKGGVVHWTHHDPSGRHGGGYLQHNGQYYQ